MTKEEFTAGWLLLTIQPWGKRYAAQDTPSRLQFEFYYSRLGRFHAEAWQVACQLFAAGDKWPSADELRTAINQSLPRRFQIAYDPKAEEKPELLVKIEAYRHLAITDPVKHGTVTILDAAEAVLPDYRKDHPEMVGDIAACETLIKKLKAHRAHVQVLQQEKAMTA